MSSLKQPWVKKNDLRVCAGQERSDLRTPNEARTSKPMTLVKAGVPSRCSREQAATDTTASREHSAVQALTGPSRS